MDNSLSAFPGGASNDDDAEYIEGLDFYEILQQLGEVDLLALLSGLDNITYSHRAITPAEMESVVERVSAAAISRLRMSRTGAQPAVLGRLTTRPEMQSSSSGAGSAGGAGNHQSSAPVGELWLLDVIAQLGYKLAEPALTFGRLDLRPHPAITPLDADSRVDTLAAALDVTAERLGASFPWVGAKIYLEIDPDAGRAVVSAPHGEATGGSAISLLVLLVPSDGIPRTACLNDRERTRRLSGPPLPSDCAWVDISLLPVLST